MNLLSMASDRAPAADDLIPVLIYVIIKVSLFFFKLDFNFKLWDWTTRWL